MSLQYIYILICDIHTPHTPSLIVISIRFPLFFDSESGIGKSEQSSVRRGEEGLKTMMQQQRSSTIQEVMKGEKNESSASSPQQQQQQPQSHHQLIGGGSGDDDDDSSSNNMNGISHSEVIGQKSVMVTNEGEEHQEEVDAVVDAVVEEGTYHQPSPRHDKEEDYTSSTTVTAVTGLHTQERQQEQHHSSNYPTPSPNLPPPLHLTTTANGGSSSHHPPQSYHPHHTSGGSSSSYPPPHDAEAVTAAAAYYHQYYQHHPPPPPQYYHHLSSYGVSPPASVSVAAMPKQQQSQGQQQGQSLHQHQIVAPPLSYYRHPPPPHYPYHPPPPSSISTSSSQQQQQQVHHPTPTPMNYYHPYSSTSTITATNNSNGNQMSNDRYCPPPHVSQTTGTATATTSTTTTTITTTKNGSIKSVRQKRKMYSDYVGVTYNKTHAKYQACITHYRKQHYLGRYKLAVDAALAYDESAKLLKGQNWKVNFSCLVEYEAARKRELDLLHTTTNYGSGGGGTCGGGVGMMRGEYDDKRGIAAVTAKVNEIATLVAQSKAAAAAAAESRMMSSQSTSNYVATSTSRSTGCSSNVDDLPVINGPSVNSSIQHRARQHWLEEEERLSTSRNVIMKMPQSAGLASSTFTTASASVGKDDKYEKKVTPSPSFPLMTGPGGEHDIDEVDIDNEDMEEEGEHSCNNNNSSDDGNSSEQRPRITRPLDTPYTLSPNPARHALGNNERDTTPDSVIRPTVLSYPTVLTYHQSVEERSSLQEQQQQCSSNGSKRRRMDGDGLDETSSSSTDAGLPLSSHHNSPSKSKTTMSMMSLDKIESSGCAVDVIAANELISLSPERIRMVVVNSTSLPTATMTKEEEPVIQNGTLAAASALMTLFGEGEKYTK